MIWVERADDAAEDAMILHGRLRGAGVAGGKRRARTRGGGG